jgi:hypothetical protein
MKQLARLRQLWEKRPNGGTIAKAGAPRDADPDPADPNPANPDPADPDPLSAFATETVLMPEPRVPDARVPEPRVPEPRAAARKTPGPKPAWKTWKWKMPDARLQGSARTTAIVALVAVLGGLAWGYARWMPVTAAEPRPATLRIETQPAAAEVIIDGQRRGTTPLSLSLSSGAHAVMLRRGNEERALSVTLAAGADVTHHVEFKTPDQPSVLTGGVSVVTDPPGARVQVDGRPRGTSPLMLTDLAPAEYKVSVKSDTGSAERAVTVKPGTMASLVFSLPKTAPAAGPVAGWLAVTAPFDVQILEDNAVVGTGNAAKIMLPAGRHSLSIVNQSLEYQETRTADVPPGKTATIRVEPPKVSVNVNARPWADVTIDGANAGQTPIANLALGIGTHEVVFRHPQFGEQRQTVVLKTHGPNRIAVDLTK